MLFAEENEPLLRLWLYAVAAIALTAVVGSLVVYGFMHVPEGLELWALLMTLVVLLRYTAVTRVMALKTGALADESIKQRRALLAPCVVAQFGGFQDHHRAVNFNVFNFSEENIARDLNPPCVLMSLTFEGWQRYDDLTRRSVDSTHGFMAMPFGNDLLDRVYRECFKEAAMDAGFGCFE